MSVKDSAEGVGEKDLVLRRRSMSLPVRSQRLLAAGAALTGLSGLAAEAAWLHMRSLADGAICGASLAPHCPLCPLSLALLAASLASLTAAYASPGVAAPAGSSETRR